MPQSVGGMNMEAPINMQINHGPVIDSLVFITQLECKAA